MDRSPMHHFYLLLLSSVVIAYRRSTHTVVSHIKLRGTDKRKERSDPLFTIHSFFFVGHLLSFVNKILKVLKIF